MSMTVSESTVVPSQITVSPRSAGVGLEGCEEAADFAEDFHLQRDAFQLAGMMLAGLFMPTSQRTGDRREMTFGYRSCRSVSKCCILSRRGEPAGRDPGIEIAQCPRSHRLLAFLAAEGALDRREQAEIRRSSAGRSRHRRRR
jgi:hypothetical protein